MNLHDILSVISQAEREAAQLILSAKSILAEIKSGKRDVVTEYDRRVQELLKQRLTELIPGASFFCEENKIQDDLNAEHVFIIDPIDGTMNFVHGYNMSCISVAYASFGEILVGAVYNPYLNEMFTAIKGEGAYCNEKKLHVDESPLSQCVCCVGTAPYHPDMTDCTFEMMRKVYLSSLDIRRSGSAALDLCSVAAGRMGLYFEEALCLWDYAAGGLCVVEAGGNLSDMNGNPLMLCGDVSSVLAAGPQCYIDFLSIE